MFPRDEDFCQASSVLTIKGYLNTLKFIFIPKLNSKCVSIYLFDGGKN